MNNKIIHKISRYTNKSAKKEIFINSLKFIRLNKKIPLIYRQRSLLLLSKYNSKINFNKTLNFCLYTGKVRFILKNLKMSRMVLKELSSTYFLMGYYKISW